MPWVRVPAGFPPRAALAFLFLPLVVLLERLGGGVGLPAEREEAVAVLTALGAELAPEVPTAENAAKALALRLAGRVPAIYGSEPDRARGLSLADPARGERQGARRLRRAARDEPQRHRGLGGGPGGRLGGRPAP